MAYRALKGYPWAIEVELNDQFYYYKIRIKSIYFICFFAIFVIGIYFVHLINRNYYKNSLNFISKKINFLNNGINNVKLNFRLDAFTDDVNKLISYVDEIKKTENNLQGLELRKKILNLALIERHFLPFNRTASTNEERLYLSKIESLINEEPISMSLIDFLRQISDYCCEFYYDNKIRIIASEEPSEMFVFKHAALSEAIFHIFTFIM